MTPTQANRMWSLVLIVEVAIVACVAILSTAQLVMHDCCQEANTHEPSK